MSYRIEVIDFIRNFFEKNGPDKNVVIAISGGKDSTICADLCVEALGKERVFGLLLPNGIQRDIDDSLKVVKYLDIKYKIINIQDMVDGFYEANDLFSNGHISFENDPEEHKYSLTNQTKLNLPPRIRMASTYAIAQTINAFVCNTTNLSEKFIGWGTLYGDTVGDFSPLGNLTTDEVIEMGLESDFIPYDLILKTPADGLTSKSDEDNFGFKYSQLNAFIKSGSSGDEVVDEIIRTKHQRTEFKRKPISTFNPVI